MTGIHSSAEGAHTLEKFCRDFLEQWPTSSGRRPASPPLACVVAFAGRCARMSLTRSRPCGKDLR